MPQPLRKERITDHLIKLMIMGESPNVVSNEKEVRLIQSLEELLEQARQGDVLNEITLACAEYKMSRVSCFAERYLIIVQELRGYQSEKSASLLPRQ